MDKVERLAMKEANNLTDEELQRFYHEIELIPSHKAPLNGKQTVLCLEFMEDTGSRITETNHVKKEDINFDTRMLIITNPKVETKCNCSTWQYRDLHTRIRVLTYADRDCKHCHGKGKWKVPQKTTITPRMIGRIEAYCMTLRDDQLLFPVPRQTIWRWAKDAGFNAHIRIFQQKKQQEIEGIFLHLFRALCSKRMIRDAKNDDYKDQLVACKLRHSFATVTDRYTKIDINYLWNWEEKTYVITK